MAHQTPTHSPKAPLLEEALASAQGWNATFCAASTFGMIAAGLDLGYILHVTSDSKGSKQYNIHSITGPKSNHGGMFRTVRSKVPAPEPEMTPAEASFAFWAIQLVINDNDAWP